MASTPFVGATRPVYNFFAMVTLGSVKIMLRYFFESTAMEIRHLQYFLAVAEELHFGRAAKRLHISQPPLSRQIRQLEDEMGVTLLQRTKRRVVLTNAGRILAEEARSILQQIEQATTLTREAGPETENRLLVGYSPHNSSIALRTLRAFTERHPNAHVLLMSLATALQIDALRVGRIDVGLLTLPAYHEDLTVDIILRDRLVVAMPRNHPLAKRRLIPVRALADETIIIFPRHLNAKRHDLIIGMCRGAGFSPRFMHEVDSIQITMELVSKGLGVSVMRPPPFEILKAGVVFRKLHHSPILETAVVFRRSSRSSLVDDFVGVAKEVASSMTLSAQKETSKK